MDGEPKNNVWGQFSKKMMSDFSDFILAVCGFYFIFSGKRARSLTHVFDRAL